MINITTLQGAKDVLSRYSGDEYCVINFQDTVAGFSGYWIVNITDVDEVIYFYKEVVSMITEIPENFICALIDEGHLVPKIPDKEWNVQGALGVAPQDRKYLIRNKVEK